MSTPIFPSMIGSILGVNRYRSRMHVLHRYTSRQVPCHSILPNSKERALSISAIERQAIDILQRDRGISCYEAAKCTVQFAQSWHLVGKCDGITSDGHLVEVKTRERYIHECTSWNDYAQIQAYLALYDMNNCYYVQKLADSDRHLIKVVRRDSHYWDNYVVPELGRFSQVVTDMLHERYQPTAPDRMI